MGAVIQRSESGRIRVPASEATAAAQDFIDVLEDYCELICIAGSLRRRKASVKDIEILFVPKIEASPVFAARTDLFRAPAPLPPINLAERAIATLLASFLLRKRPNVNGIKAWGEKNKLGIHAPSGLPVDLFTATRENFFNYLVCRTGGAESNIRVCEAAIARGWKWNPYGSGFSRCAELGRVEQHAVQSEREVFEFVGLPYLEPWER
jgi:DNA polymerase/3'-5' exonuclease PolX